MTRSTKSLKTRFAIPASLLVGCTLAALSALATGCGGDAFQTSGRKVATGVPQNDKGTPPTSGQPATTPEGTAQKNADLTAKNQPQNDALPPEEKTAGEDDADPSQNTDMSTESSDNDGSDAAMTGEGDEADPSNTSLGTGASPGSSNVGSGTIGGPAVTTAAAKTSFTDDNNNALSSDEQRLLAACLKQWPNHPFTEGKTYRVRKISTSFSFGGVTLAGNDSPTAEPKLVLMKTSINLNIPGITGTAEYNFMNPNGYYCMTNQINVLADVRINLHCKARLASGENQFSVLSATNGSVSQSQVSLLSNVFVYRICQ